MMRSVSVVLVLTAGSACMSVRPVPAPEQFIPAQQPEVVWVTTTQEEVIPVAGPTVRNASITGTWLGLGDSIAVPLQDTRAVQARQRDHRRTALLAAGVAAAVGFVVWRATAGHDSGAPACYGWEWGTPQCY